MMCVKSLFKRTDAGIQCHFFDNNDGTGWKIFHSSAVAVRTRATQMYFSNHGFAPQVLSRVHSSTIVKQDDSFICPVSGRRAYFSEDTKSFVIYKPFIGIHEVNCSEHVIEHHCRCARDGTPEYIKIYGFLTQVVNTKINWHAVLHRFSKDGFNVHDPRSFRDYLEVKYSARFHDIRGGNIGALDDGRPVLVDTGSHLYEGFENYEIVDGINDIITSDGYSRSYLLSTICCR